MKLGIIIGGGPAPGINTVIGAATIEAIKNGAAVLGFYDGFKHLTGPEFDSRKHVLPLKIADVGRIHFEGGPILRTSRSSLLAKAGSEKSSAVSPDTDKVQRVCQHLHQLGIEYLLTIGGDDTALSARYVAEHSLGKIRVAHVPKTIDNDLPLAGGTPTFGFTSARNLGTELVANLMEDSRATNRWYIVETMGRNSGFLALGIGKAAGATLTIIPEEIPKSTTIVDLATVLEGAILKRRSMGRNHGVAVLAEGLLYKIGDLNELNNLVGKQVPVDAAGHPRLSEIALANLLKDELSRRFAQRDDHVTLIGHTLGYELRCARPGSYDLGYCRDLGHGGVRLLVESGHNIPNGFMVTIQHGQLVPVPFDSMIDPQTHRTQIRQLDINSYSYRVARAYMIRLEIEDFASCDTIEPLARQAGLTSDQFCNKYQDVIEHWNRPHGSHATSLLTVE